MQGLILSALASTAMAIPVSNPITPSLSVPLPLNDSFYDTPSGLDQMSNGQVYDSRLIDPVSKGQLNLAQVSQIAYKTEGTYSNSTHSVATILKPSNPAKEAKLFSYQVWKDSDELNCSPSYYLAEGLFGPHAPSTILDTAATIEFALLNGWYVVVPDHEAYTSSYLEGYTQGHAGLDGIRAAISYLNLDPNTPTTMYGYSGGASATVWMTNLHESYAPEINVVGAAHGGTPVDYGSNVRSLDRADNAFSGFIPAGLGGLLNGYPDKKEAIWPHLNEKLQNAINILYTPNNCVVTEVATMGNTEWLTQMDVDFWTYPPLVEILSRESLLKNVSTGIVSVPKFPRYIFHAEADEIAPVAPIEQYVQEQCAGGANIQWVPWKGPNHVSTESVGLPDAYRFLKQAFDGTVQQGKCGTAPTDILTLASTNLVYDIGQVVADVILATNGLKTPLGTISFDPKQGYQS